MTRRLALTGFAILAAASAVRGEDRIIGYTTPEQPGLVFQELIYDTAPYPSCHASTIVSLKSGLVAAWFGGTYEKHRDVAIWVSRYDGTRWTPMVEAANGNQSDGGRFPCWNPVLVQPSTPADAPLILFYKVGPSPSEWWGMRVTSTDGGRTWSKPERLPDGILGPVKNKPIELPGGVILCGSSTEHDGWRAHVERTSDQGVTWTKSGSLNDGNAFSAIQPTILRHGDALQMLFRTKQGKIAESWSKDSGATWSELAATSLPNNNSGLDAVTLADGTSLLIYNHTTRGRSMLNLAATRDGKTWQAAMVLENQPGEYSYPAIIQSADGKVHMTYTFERKRIKHVVVNPSQLVLRDIVNGEWPK